MKILFAIWLFLCRLFGWLYLKSNCYRVWSWIHQRIYDRKWDAVPVSVYLSLVDLHRWISTQTWVADGWRELFDAVCTPNKVQAVGQTGDHKIGDCDEFAIYLTAAVEKSLAAGLMQSEKIANPRFFTVMWMETTGKANGHNVCLLEYPQTDGTTWYSYMDYFLPSPKRPTVEEVAADVRVAYATSKGESKPIVWCVQTSNMRPLKTQWG